MEHPAQFYASQENDTVICQLCPAECIIKPGQYGLCGCRINKNRELVTENYGELVTLALDPIEKKPLYHFHPTEQILSTGANGCNFNCANCQNWNISQKKVPTRYASPEQLVELTADYDSIGVAFTYTEPMIWYEYIIDTAPLLHEAGFKTVLVSNGYINSKPLEKLLGFIDAVNIDLKGMDPDFYKKICKGKLEPVLDNIRTFARSTTHLELTNLVIPGYNDSENDFHELTDFIASVSDMIPLHFSAYHPDYKLNIPSTPLDTMLKARDIAQTKLKYVYLGNVITDAGQSTFCPKCRNLLIDRSGYSTKIMDLNGSRCSKCDFDTKIVC